MPHPLMIIDGYNLLLAGRGLREPERLAQLRDQLSRQLAGYAALKKVRLILVFDGREKVHQQRQALAAGIQVRYSKPPENADTLIKRLVEREQQPARHVTVVTSDRGVADYVTSCGCRHWTAAAFRKKLTSPQPSTLSEDKTSSPLSPAQLAEWLELFGVNGE